MVAKFDKELSQYLDWKEFPRRYPDLVTHNQMRHIVASRHFNGFGSACRKIHSRLILVHLPTCLQWFEQHSEG